MVQIKKNSKSKVDYVYECLAMSAKFLTFGHPKRHLSQLDTLPHSYRGCSGSQKVGARKIARCQFRSQLKILQGANFFEPKLWMIACTTTSFMYKWSGFVCTNVNVCIVLLFFISISSPKTKDQNHGNVMFYQLVSNLHGMFPS
jgi:hypothetical protein